MGGLNRLLQLRLGLGGRGVLELLVVLLLLLLLLLLLMVVL